MEMNIYSLLLLGFLLVYHQHISVECASLQRHIRSDKDVKLPSIQRSPADLSVNQTGLNQNTTKETIHSSPIIESNAPAILTKSSLSNDTTNSSIINDVVADIKDAVKAIEDDVERTTGKETGRSLNIDIEKYVSPEFHNKNNVYILPTSPEIQKYIDPETHDFTDFTGPEVTSSTPLGDLLDTKFRLVADSIKQNLQDIEHLKPEKQEDQDAENYEVDTLIDKANNPGNDTEVSLKILETKTIEHIDDQTKGKKSDTEVETGKNVDYKSNFLKTKSYDESYDSKNPKEEEKPTEQTIESTVKKVTVTKENTKESNKELIESEPTKESKNDKVVTKSTKEPLKTTKEPIKTTGKPLIKASIRNPGKSIRHPESSIKSSEESNKNLDESTRNPNEVAKSTDEQIKNPNASRNNTRDAEKNTDESQRITKESTKNANVSLKNIDESTRNVNHSIDESTTIKSTKKPVEKILTKNTTEGYKLKSSRQMTTIDSFTTDSNSHAKSVTENSISRRGSTKYIDSLTKSSTTPKEMDIDGKGFSIPPSATAWALATLKDVPNDNKTKTSDEQTVQENNIVKITVPPPKIVLTTQIPTNTDIITTETLPKTTPILLLLSEALKESQNPPKSTTEKDVPKIDLKNENEIYKTSEEIDISSTVLPLSSQMKIPEKNDTRSLEASMESEENFAIKSTTIKYTTVLERTNTSKSPPEATTPSVIDIPKLKNDRESLPETNSSKNLLDTKQSSETDLKTEKSSEIDLENQFLIEKSSDSTKDVNHNETTTEINKIESRVIPGEAEGTDIEGELSTITQATPEMTEAIETLIPSKERTKDNEVVTSKKLENETEPTSPKPDITTAKLVTATTKLATAVTKVETTTAKLETTPQNQFGTTDNPDMSFSFNTSSNPIESVVEETDFEEIYPEKNIPETKYDEKSSGPKQPNMEPVPKVTEAEMTTEPLDSSTKLSISSTKSTVFSTVSISSVKTSVTSSKSTSPPVVESDFNDTTEPIPLIPKLEPKNVHPVKTTALPNFIPAIEENNSTTTIDPSNGTGMLSHDDEEENSPGMVAAIAISTVGAVCLILLAGLLIIMRKRQKRVTYGQRCRPVSLDAYSLDNVSVYNSVRRGKSGIRASKRSYGNPAFDDPVSISHQMNFQSLVRFDDNADEITAEFDEIPQVTARANEVPPGCETKNRYANIIPLPETRVFLKASDNDPLSDYINANYVTGPKNTRGYYIACQAPMDNTIDDFWRMIWEQQSRVILMLTNLFENGIEKCADYLPPSEVLDCHRLFGDFQITLKKRDVKEKYVISSLQLKNMVSNSWREVTHLWYMGWPERGVPSEANSLIAFLIEARSHLKAASNNNHSKEEKESNNLNISGVSGADGGPVIVHCSPGTGRTGTVISCDIAIRDFELTRTVDIPKIVYRVRRDRASAVQTRDQYAFIYKVITLYATKLTGGALDSI